MIPGGPDPRYPHVRKTRTLHIHYCPKDQMATGRKVDPQSDFAYRLVLDMIFATGDRVPDDDNFLAEVTRRSVGKWRKAKRVLLDWDLLRIEGDRITSGEAQDRLDRLEVQIAQKSRAGRVSAEARDAARRSEHSSRPDFDQDFDADFDAEFYRNSEANPLENNETCPTAVPTAGPTNLESKKEDDDNNRARAREDGPVNGSGPTPAPEPETPTAPEPEPPATPPPAEPPVAVPPVPPSLAEPFVPPPKPPRMDPNAWALVQAMTDAVIGAYGVDEGGMARAFNDPTDAYTAAALIKAAADLGLETGEAIDAVREHLRRKCVEFKADNPERSPPRALKWFSDSAHGALRSLAKARDKAAKGFGSGNGSGRGDCRSGNGYRGGSGGDPVAHTVVQRSWERAVGELARSRKFAEARQVQAEAKANGDAAANALADRLMETALGKRRAA